MSLPQSSVIADSTGQSSIPIQTFASGGSSLPMNTLPNISVVDSYSTVTTDQSTRICFQTFRRWIPMQSSQQQSNVGSGLFGERSGFLRNRACYGYTSGAFEDAFQRLIDHNENTGSATLSRSMTSGFNTATGAVSSEVPPVSMVNNPLHHAIFQTSATDTPVQNLGVGSGNSGSHNAALQGIQSWYYLVVPSQPAFVSPPGNFTFDGRQLPPLSPQYGTPVMMLGTSWGQQLPYQRFQVPWLVTLGMQQVGNATNNTVARNAQGANKFQLQNVAASFTNATSTRISGGPITTEWTRRHIGNQNLGNRHNPRHQRLWGQGGGRHQVDLGNKVRQEPDAAANDNQQQNFETVNNNALIKLRLFPYSLKGTAFDWYRSLAPGSIQSWKMQQREFLSYFRRDTTRLSIVDLSEIQQKFGETAKAYLIRFRQMYAKIPDKYDKPTIVKMAIAGIQDYKVKLAVAPHSVRSLNHLADIVRRCEKVIKDKREKNPGKTKQWFNKAPIVEVNQNQWVHDEDDDEYEVNAAEIVNVRNYTCDALRRPTVPHSYNTPPPVGAPAGTSRQADGANIGRVYSFDISQQEAIFDDMFQKGHIYVVFRNKLQKMIDDGNVVVEDLVEMSINPFPPQHHMSWTHTINDCVVFRNKLQKMFDDGNVVVEDLVEMSINPFPPQHQVRMVNVGFGSHSSDACLVTGCEDCDKVHNKVPKTFRLKELATATTISPKAVANTLVVPEAASFIMEPHDATVGGIQLLSQEDGPEIIAADANPFAAQANAVENYYYDSEVGPYRLVGMDKYGRPQQATMRRDMTLPEWKLLLQEVNMPYNYNMLRPLPAAPSIEEVFNEDN
ncbi:OLC1v1004963C1 [Oldenlandia corymbosa var. corymbosa]|uniref:OLC1v1004963C1 n=1 Tax=Oldenlandia corymbosa var. corymbosa TaxID=529605 RepID=A0AAV1DDJ6_OLDCO|nr:OLC1v1004963C1 [Oldenlandia corymbosa var. corymbosa]